MHHQFRLPFCNEIQAQRAGIPLRSQPPLADDFTQSSCRKPVTTSLTSPTSSLRTLATRTSPSCSTRTPLSPILRSSPLMKPQPAKIHEVWSHSSFEPSASPFSLRHPYGHVLLYAHPQCRGQETTRLQGYMHQHNVDFIGGDFNMSAFSTVGDVFSDPEKFSAPGNSLLSGLGALEEANRERTGFLIMPKRPYEWRVDSHGCYKFNNADLALGPRDSSAHFPVFPYLRATNLPGPDSITRSEQAQQRRLERNATRPDRRKRRRG